MESGLLLSQIKTPAFVVERQIVERNGARMRDTAAKRSVQLRPHVKTHKTIEAGRYQIGEGVEGKIVASTIAEVRHFAQGGFTDILYGVPVCAQKLDELAELSKQLKALHVMLDSRETMEALVKYSEEHNKHRWSVFLKVDTGYHRHGVDPTDPAAARLAVDLANTHKEHIDFMGIYSHSGHSYDVYTTEECAQIAQTECDVMTAFADMLRTTHGIICQNVSVGATPSACQLPASLGGVTELHPGNYIFFDKDQIDLGSCKLEDVACRVIARVIGHYPNHIMIDAGALALSKDLGASHLLPSNDSTGYGYIEGHPDLRIIKCSQEVSKIVRSDLRSSASLASEFPIGSLISIIPNHSCLASALFNEYLICDTPITSSQFFDLNNARVVDKWLPCRGW